MDIEPVFQGQSSNNCVNPPMVLDREAFLTSIYCACNALSAKGRMTHDSHLPIQSILRKQSLNENEGAFYGLISL